jgi:hypothetical protein
VRAVSTGEDCPKVGYTPESVAAPAYSVNDSVAVYSSGACRGRAQFDLLPLADGASLYAGPAPDGGAAWVLAVDFFPDLDAGACDVNGSCTDLYVGTDQKL